LKIKNIHTDNAKVYKRINKKYNNTGEKSQTTQVESFNSVLRTYVSPLIRRTKSYVKCIYNIISELKSFLLLYNKKLKKDLEIRNFCTIFAKDNMIDKRCKGCLLSVKI